MCVSLRMDIAIGFVNLTYQEGIIKKDDMFLVENEEMVCSDCIVDYGRFSPG